MVSSIMGIVYDGIFAALVLAALLLGRRRGFLATLVLLLGSLLAILGAAWAARTFGPQLYDDHFGALVSEQVQSALAQAGGDAAALVAELDFLPDTMRQALRETLAGAGAEAGPYAAEALKPVILPLVQALVFLLFYLLLRVVVRLLASILRQFNHLPLLGSLNQILGVLLGLLIGAINCWACSLVLWVASSLAAGRVPILEAGVLAGSRFYRVFAHFNPFLTLY